MRVDEIFSSIEGEGKLIGYPMTFVRFFGCNLNCCWCDTDYSERGRADGTMLARNRMSMDPQQILKEIKKFPNRWVCFTGGEPCLAPKDEMNDLVTMLNSYGYKMMIETNGTVVPAWNYHILSEISCSPKLQNSGCPIIKEDLYKFIGAMVCNDSRGMNRVHLKFVVDKGDEMFEVRRLLSYLADGAYRPDVTIQPVDGALEDVARLFEDAQKIGVFDGYDVRFLPQLHKSLGAR